MNTVSIEADKEKHKDKGYVITVSTCAPVQHSMRKSG